MDFPSVSDGGQEERNGNFIPLTSILQQALGTIQFAEKIVRAGHSFSREEMYCLMKITEEIRIIERLQEDAQRSEKEPPQLQSSPVTSLYDSGVATTSIALRRTMLADVSPISSCAISSDSVGDDIDSSQTIPNIKMNAKELWDYCNQLSISDQVPRNCNILEGYVEQQDDQVSESSNDEEVLIDNIDHFGEMFERERRQRPVVLITNLLRLVNLDTSLFTPEAFARANPQQRIDCREQYPLNARQNKTTNRKKPWDFYSHPSTTTIAKQAALQIKAMNLLRNEDNGRRRRRKAGGRRRRVNAKLIHFGTNIDLDNQDVWCRQLGELSKLPEYLRVDTEHNLLNRLCYKIPGLNGIQAYMKLDGCSTPGHYENNDLCSVNINFSEHSTTWYSIHPEYKTQLFSVAKRLGYDILRDCIWPIIAELKSFGIPVSTTVQEKFDVVYVTPGVYHFVSSSGPGNAVAYNLFPMDYDQYLASARSYEFNKERQFKSLVPLTYLTWEIAKGVPVKDIRLFSIIRTILMNSMLYLVRLEMFVKRKKIQTVFEDVNDNSFRHCAQCEAEVFAMFFVKLDPENAAKKPRRTLRRRQPIDTTIKYCIGCMNLNGWDDVICIQRNKLDHLMDVYDGFRFTATG